MRQYYGMYTGAGIATRTYYDTAAGDANTSYLSFRTPSDNKGCIEPEEKELLFDPENLDI